MKETGTTNSGIEIFVFVPWPNVFFLFFFSSSFFCLFVCFFYFLPVICEK